MALFTVNQTDRDPESLQGNEGLGDGLPQAQHPHQRPDFRLLVAAIIMK